MWKRAGASHGHPMGTSEIGSKSGRLKRRAAKRGRSTALAQAIYVAMKRHDRSAAVIGEPVEGVRTMIDGIFNLRVIARNALRALELEDDDTYRSNNSPSAS